MRTILGLLAMASATPAAAQLDPVVTAQGQLLSATMRGHAERDAARLRRGVPSKSAAQRKHEADCATLWKLHDRMNRAQANRLYDLCPR